MNAKQEYKELEQRVRTLEDQLTQQFKEQGKYVKYGIVYLFDECIDAENVQPLTEQDAGYWEAMIGAAHYAIGMRMEEMGINPAEHNIRY